MINFENTEVSGWEHAIRGMRNPMNSWEKSDSFGNEEFYKIGEKDFELMLKLSKNGAVHAKFRRMITVYVDITAPLYWWKEFDTYKVGTVSNSCSTMHKIHEKEFVTEDFSCEYLIGDSLHILMETIKVLNIYRNKYNNYEGFTIAYKNSVWYQMIQLLPSSYNQKRTIMLNYEVLAGIYKHRKNHKLDEWKCFCNWIEKLLQSDIITCGN